MSVQAQWESTVVALLSFKTSALQGIGWATPKPRLFYTRERGSVPIAEEAG